MSERTIGFCLAVAVCLFAASAGAQTGASQPATAQSSSSSTNKPKGKPRRLKEFVIYGAAPEPDKSSLSASRAANPASVSVAKYPVEVKRSTNTYGDLLRPITGVTVNTYGQGGLGYGVTIRGFDTLEHGRDVATFVDGVPQNQTSSIQVNG